MRSFLGKTRLMQETVAGAPSAAAVDLHERKLVTYTHKKQKGKKNYSSDGR